MTFLTRDQRRWSTAIKGARKQLGITQEQAAALLGVRQSTVSGWELGRRVPSDAMKPTVISRLGINPADVRPEWAA